MSHSGKQLTSHAVGDEITVGPLSVKVHRITHNRVFLRWRSGEFRVSIVPASKSEPLVVGPAAADPLQRAMPELAIP